MAELSRQEQRAAEERRREAERIAVPEFDWIGQPIAGLIDAALSLGSHHPHLRWHRHHERDGQDGQMLAP
jgi:hypothetical protein